MLQFLTDINPHNKIGKTPQLDHARRQVRSGGVPGDVPMLESLLAPGVMLARGLVKSALAALVARMGEGRVARERWDRVSSDSALVSI